MAREVGLKIKPEKCQLIKKQVVYLRHVIKPAGIGTDPQKTAAVQQCRITRYVRKVRQFLGLSSYYQRFIKGFARGTLSGGSVQNAEEPVDEHPDTQTPGLIVDVSNAGIREVLFQTKELIAYISRALT
ncbi:Retrovirus-related Pol polyprotein from transposon 17.6 [Trichinella sp. T6]|nr:Retrovirus-related Pol polyprotein from transposon 17.6 [Trichinella sp. T6]